MNHKLRTCCVLAIALLTPALASPAFGQTFDRAPVVRVTLADYKFDPSTLRLRAGKPIILRLTNVAAQPHEFGAPEFFARASVRSSDAKAINKEGEAEVGPQETVQIGIVPKAGTYALQCNKPGHAQRGMKGTIVVK